MINPSSGHRITARVWIYKGDSPWHFITIPKEDAISIRKDYKWPRRGFGAIPVMVILGSSKWKTSVFPEKDGTYLLPIKKEIRKNERVETGNVITVTLKVVE